MARFEWKNTVNYFLRIRDGANGPGGPLQQTDIKRRLFQAYLRGGPDLEKDYDDAKASYDNWLPKSHPV
jgi:hypothetical protein